MKEYRMPYLRTLEMDDLLKHNSFSIPRYQRKFSWGSNEVDDLLYDIMAVVNGEQISHFFGSIVTYNPTKDSQMVIDGQQRITTSMILLAVIRDLVRKLRQQMSKKDRFKDPDVDLELRRINMSANKLLFGTSVYNKESTLSLRIRKPLDKNSNKQNYGKYLRGLIVKDGTAHEYEDVKYKPIQLLRIVHRKLRRDITQLLNNHRSLKDKTQLLSKIYTAFTEQFYIILMEANNNSDALTIYMTLNNRGKELTTADIVKGQLAGILEKDNSRVATSMDNWSDMSKDMQSNAKVISKFIKEYWEARYSYESQDNLARSIVQQIRTPSDARVMIDDLMELAPVYNTVTNKSNKSVFKSKPLNRAIKLLNAMSLVQYYPVVLAMYHKNYSERDIYAVVNDVERIEMRHLLKHIAHTKYGDESHLIWNGDLTAEQIINNLNEKQLVNDADTHRAGASYQHKYAKSGKGISILIYMIAKIYAYENNDFNNGQNIYYEVFDENKYSVIRLSYRNDDNNLNSIGNWTILEKSLCRQANKNRNLNDLCEVLNNSELSSNHNLVNSLKSYSTNIDELIAKRQDKFADDYIKVW